MKTENETSNGFQVSSWAWRRRYMYINITYRSSWQ